MNWKEFLKPNLWKIVLTIIFIYLTYFLAAFGLRSPITCPNIRTSGCTHVNLPQYSCGACAENLNLFDYIYGYCLTAITYISFIALPAVYIAVLIPYAGLVLLVLYNYIISCLIVYAIASIRKRRYKDEIRSR